MKGQLIGNDQTEPTGAKSNAFQRCRLEVSGFTAAFVDTDCGQHGHAARMTDIKLLIPAQAAHDYEMMSPAITE
jgi:hypothetical protein